LAHPRGRGREVQNVGRIKEHVGGNLEEGGENEESARRLKSSGMDIQQCSYFIKGNHELNTYECN
jgi:hypothetical protein